MSSALYRMVSTLCLLSAPWKGELWSEPSTLSSELTLNLSTWPLSKLSDLFLRSNWSDLPFSPYMTRNTFALVPAPLTSPVYTVTSWGISTQTKTTIFLCLSLFIWTFHKLLLRHYSVKWRNKNVNYLGCSESVVLGTTPSQSCRRLHHLPTSGDMGRPRVLHVKGYLLWRYQETNRQHHLCCHARYVTFQPDGKNTSKIVSQETRSKLD